MEIYEKIVDFHKYCKTCKFKDTEEQFIPCCECLESPTNVNSQKPVKYTEDEKLVKKEQKNK